MVFFNMFNLVIYHLSQQIQDMIDMGYGANISKSHPKLTKKSLKKDIQ